MNNDDLLETLKITIELVKKLNNEKRDYIKSIVKICIALIISFTIINKLMGQMDKFAESLDKFNDTLIGMDKRLESIEDKSK